MFGKPFRDPVCSTAKRFIRADQGNIAVLFAIALVPLLSFVGAAIDYTRANSARSAMQAALNSTALMVSKDLSQGLITTANVSTAAQAYFTALYTNPDAKSVAVSATYTANSTSGSTIQVVGSGQVTTDFMKVAGFPTLSFNTSSTAAWGNVRMRVAMALDNTGSMAQDGKMPALQTAAKSLVDQLSALAKNPGDVYISIVPFAKDVNIGASLYTQSWIDWRDWEAEAVDLQGSKPSNWSQVGPGSPCPFSMQNDGFTCLSGAASTTVVSDVPSNGQICPGPDPSSRYGFAYHYLVNGCYTSVAGSTQANVCTGSSCNCNNYSNSCTCTGSGSGKACKQPAFTHVWTPNNHNTWSGCITDRAQDYDTKNTSPTSTPDTMFPAEQYYENGKSYCKPGNNPPLQPLTLLSYDWTALKSAIDAMEPTGGTNQPIGLAVAWQTLSTAAPVYAPAMDPNYTYKSAIVILSDGLNTENRWPSYGDGSSQNGTLIDDRQKILCDNAKAAGVTIYTIQLNTSTSNPDPTSAVLQYCASGSQNFYLVKSASQTLTAFNSIGTSLSKLRVSR